MRPWKAGSRYATCGTRPRESRHVRRRQFGVFTALHSGHRKADGSLEKVAPVDCISIRRRIRDACCKPHHATRPPDMRPAAIGFGHYPGDLPNGPFDTGKKGGPQNGRGEGGTPREHVGRSRSRERPMAGRNAPAGRGGRMAGHPPGNAPPLGKVRAAGAREDGAVPAISNPLPAGRRRAAHGGNGARDQLNRERRDSRPPSANPPSGETSLTTPRTCGRNWKLALPDSPEPSAGRYRGNRSVMLHPPSREFCIGGRVHRRPHGHRVHTAKPRLKPSVSTTRARPQISQAFSPRGYRRPKAEGVPASPVAHSREYLAGFGKIIWPSAGR